MTSRKSMTSSYSPISHTRTTTTLSNITKPRSPCPFDDDLRSLGQERPVRKRNARRHIGKMYQSYRHPWEDRTALSEDYEPQVTDRGGWWYRTLKETPAPGSYETDTFLEEIDKRPATYRFKSDGRSRDAQPHGKGAMLMPGAYQHQDFLYRLERTPTTYMFKTVSRDSMDVLNHHLKDKDLDLSPQQYNTSNYLSVSAERQPSTHSMFKSKAKRFPTIYFRPKEGPAPGNYENRPESPRHPISSSFLSRTSRFHSAQTKVPGPGTYDKIAQSPMPESISKMGRQHGLFFSSSFQA